MASKQMVLTPLVGGEQIVLDKAILLFGRAPDCDVVLTGSQKVSRKHCCVAQIQNYFVVRDLGSMNGVRVNGARIKRESKLKAGDQLAIGDIDFRLELAEVQKRGPSSAKSVWVGNSQDGIRRAPAHLVSREIPVAIPEDEFDLIVEEEDEAETLQPAKPKAKQKPKPKPKKKSPRAKAAKPKRGDSDEVIVLGDDDIIN
jgi:pSer/pThr/pTyr-binding forkhead associated (FHA) protein